MSSGHDLYPQSSTSMTLNPADTSMTYKGCQLPLNEAMQFNGSLAILTDTIYGKERRFILILASEVIHDFDHFRLSL